MKLEELLEMKTAYETAFWRNEDYDGADCLDGFINRYGEVLYEAMKELEKYLKRGKTMNKMKEVAKISGVELGEPFNIVGDNYNPYKFTLEGLTGSDGNVYPISQHDLLLGRLQIKKLPYKPKKNDAYYYVCAAGRVHQDNWDGYAVDYYNYNYGNCFRTKEEIAQEDIDRILKDMKWKYEGDGK